MTDFAQYITDALLDGQTVEIDGLGKFRLSMSDCGRKANFNSLASELVPLLFRKIVN